MGYNWIKEMEYNRRQDSRRILESSGYRQTDDNTYVKLGFNSVKLDDKGNICS